MKSVTYLFAVVCDEQGNWKRAKKIGAEHSENVTIDPIVSMAGTKYCTQIIFKAAHLDTSMIFMSATLNCMTSVSENVRILIHLARPVTVNLGRSDTGNVPRAHQDPTRGART